MFWQARKSYNSQKTTKSNDEVLCRFKEEYLVIFSFPDVKWQFTKPKDVPLNMKETPTAPLLPFNTKTYGWYEQKTLHKHIVWIQYKTVLKTVSKKPTKTWKWMKGIKKNHQYPLRLIVLALESQRKQSADYYNKNKEFYSSLLLIHW